MNTESGSSSGYSRGEWIFALVIFVVGATISYVVIDPYSDKHGVKAQEQLEKYEKSRATDEKLKKWKLEGEKSLEDSDNAIRKEAVDRRASLEKAAIRTTMSNSHGVRIDHYFLKSGKVITCTTTISGNSPAMFDCDGRL